MPSRLLRLFLRKSPQISASTGQGAYQLTFLGTAGFVLKTPERTIVLDPYLSRPGLAQSLFGRLQTNPDLIRQHLPAADDVLVGHAHYDHILDAPELCKQTGARLIGSQAVCHVGRAAGLPESQLYLAQPRQAIACGGHTVHAIPSIHGKALLGKIPLPGDILRPPPWPPRITDLRHGDVFLWHVEVGGTRLLHVDSADWLERDLEGYQADILLLCAVGRQYRKGYTAELIRRTGARCVIPCHWDDFTAPLHAPVRQLPGVDLEGFVREIQQCGAEARVLGLLDRYSF